MWKLLALVPIIGVTLALNAETVTDMVYKNDEPQKQVSVKKGKINATIKTSDNQTMKVVEQDKNVTAETVEKQENEPNAAVLILNTKQEGEEPLLIVDGKIATIDQVRALPKDSVARVAMMREKTAIKSYGEKARNGALIITTVKHQEEIDNEQLSQPDVFDKVDEAPQFPGGFSGLMLYLSNNIRYPEDAKEAGAQGRVVVSFIVEKDGSISNAKVTKPTYSCFDDEALRVVSAMPKWMPGKQNGEAVRVKYSLPVTFRHDSQEAPKPEGTVMSMPVVSPSERAEIDENGRITINGREVKRRLFDGSHPDDNKVGLAIANIMLNDIEHFDYKIDGEPVAAKDLLEVRQKSFAPIKSIEYIPKDSEHPKDRLLITTEKKE